MIDDEPEDPIATARKLIPLITKSIANSNETKSLALMNSRAELDFQLRLALLELGNDQPLSQDDKRLSRYVRPLLELLADLIKEDNNHHSKTGDPHQRLQAALTRISCAEADSPELSLIRLPQTVKELRAVTQKIFGFRKPNSSRDDVQLDLEVGRDSTSTHHRTATQEGSHVNKVNESWGENRNGHVPNHSVDSKVLATLESQHAIRTEPQRQPSDKQTKAEEFMRQADTFYDQKILPLEKKEAIKVAVLDTGVDEREIHFKAVRGQRGTSIRGVISFIGDSPHDTDGHGTRVAALVVKMAPHVDLYIAKVSEGKEIDSVGQYVKAINWAMDRKVHIINISAAINETKSIYEAIDKAEGQGIIVFAAASNNGANTPRAFPASMDKVLAIHATDGYGKSSNMNPNPLEDSPNFSTLGESIPSPLKEGELLPSGTSFSTPIAAGMAANILTLVEACFDGSEEDDERLRDRAFKREGIGRIFKKAASRGPDGYRYVCPGMVGCPGKVKRGKMASHREWFREALDHC